MVNNKVGGLKFLFWGGGGGVEEFILDAFKRKKISFRDERKRESLKFTAQLRVHKTRKKPLVCGSRAVWCLWSSECGKWAYTTNGPKPMLSVKCLPIKGEG